jgi:agmatinase
MFTEPSESKRTGTNAMALPLTVPPKTNHKSFFIRRSTPISTRSTRHIAFIGIPHGSPYSMEDVNNEQSRAPTAIRQATDRAVRSLERYDYDIGGPLYLGKPIKAVDCGDVPGNMHDFQDHVRRAEQAIRKILKAGALPMILGGDHAIPIPVLRAFEGRRPDHAHPDRCRISTGATTSTACVTDFRARSAAPPKWTTSRTFSRSASARRAAPGRRKSRPQRLTARTSSRPMSCTTPAWMRSSTASRTAASITSPSTPTAWIPPRCRPSPVPRPGGVTFVQARKLIHGLVKKGRVVGMDIVEITPALDVNRITLDHGGAPVRQSDRRDDRRRILQGLTMANLTSTTEES